MSTTYLAAAETRAVDATSNTFVDAAEPLQPRPASAAAQAAAARDDASAALIATTMRGDLAAGLLTMGEYAREARTAGVPAADVAAVLKQHAAAKEAAFMEGKESVPAQTET